MGLSDKIGLWCVRIYKPLGRRSLNRLFNQEINKLKNDATPKKILNIGSGGDIYDRIKTIPQSDVVQLDIDEKREPDIVADACNMHMLEDDSFDLVFAMEVLEHIPTPQAAVDEINRVLKPGGKFICSVPFLFPIHDEPYDFYRYTKYGLKHLLREFKDITITERNGYLHAVLLLMARTLVIGNKKQRIASFFVFALTCLIAPFLFLLELVFDSRLATTGYLATAFKE
jgi:SAM-dependent methyltransferase